MSHLWHAAQRSARPHTLQSGSKNLQTSMSCKGYWYHCDCNIDAYATGRMIIMGLLNIAVHKLQRLFSSLVRIMNKKVNSRDIWITLSCLACWGMKTCDVLDVCVQQTASCALDGIYSGSCTLHASKCWSVVAVPWCYSSCHVGCALNVELMEGMHVFLC